MEEFKSEGPNIGHKLREIEEFLQDLGGGLLAIWHRLERIETKVDAVGLVMPAAERAVLISRLNSNAKSIDQATAKLDKLAAVLNKTAKDT